MVKHTSLAKMWNVHLQSGSWGKHASVRSDISCLELREVATRWLCGYIDITSNDVVVYFCGNPLLNRSQSILWLGLYDGCFVEVGVKCKGGISIVTKKGKKRTSVSSETFDLHNLCVHPSI